MTEHIDQDEIGRLIRSTADNLPVTSPHLDRLASASRHRRRVRRATGTAAVMVVAAISAGLILEGRSSPSTTVGTASPPAAVLPSVKPGQVCPATPGVPVSNAYFGGYELGSGPVRMLIANAGNLRRGIVYVGPADTSNSLGPANYYAFQDFWYSLPSYKGAWTVTARRLDGSGDVLFGNSEPTPTAQPVPAGAAQEFGPGYRSGVGSTWIKAPGCYGFHVSGQGLSETIVVQVVLR
jgi:hypothetical protein